MYTYSEDARLSETNNDEELSDGQIGSSRQVLYINVFSVYKSHTQYFQCQSLTKLLFYCSDKEDPGDDMDMFEPVGNSGDCGSKFKGCRSHLPARKRREKGMLNFRVSGESKNSGRKVVGTRSVVNVLVHVWSVGAGW